MLESLALKAALVVGQEVAGPALAWLTTLALGARVKMAEELHEVEYRPNEGEEFRKFVIGKKDLPGEHPFAGEWLLSFPREYARLLGCIRAHYLYQGDENPAGFSAMAREIGLEAENTPPDFFEDVEKLRELSRSREKSVIFRGFVRG